MCKWIDKVVDGVEVYQVGKQQLWVWCGWTARGFDSACSYNNELVLCYADSLRKGVYVLVAGPATFGKYWRPRVYDSFTSLAAAVEYALYEMSWHGYHIKSYANNGNIVTVGYDFEIWHVVDDSELWQEWDNASAAYIALHQPEAPQMQPVVVDEARSRYGWDNWDKICSVYVPFAGQNISFLVRERKEYGCYVRSEFVSADYVNGFYPVVEQPMTVDDAYYYKWYSVHDLVSMWYEQLDTLDSLRQLREAGAIA